MSPEFNIYILEKYKKKRKRIRKEIMRWEKRILGRR